MMDHGFETCPTCDERLIGRGGNRQICPSCGFFILHVSPPPRPIGITPRQRQCLDYIVGYQAKHGFCPSMDEIRTSLGLATKSGVVRLLDALEDRGRVRRRYKRARSIEILEAA